MAGGVTKEEKLLEKPSEPVSFRSVDYLFLIEVYCETDLSITDDIIHTIGFILGQTADRQIYHDVSTQVGIVVYSYKEELEYLYARDFSSELPSDFFSFLLTETKLIGCNTSSYLSMNAGIQATERMLNLRDKEKHFHQSIVLSSNKSVSIWHRPYSDLHIVTYLYGTIRGDSGDTVSVDSVDIFKNHIEDNIDILSDKLASLRDHPISIHLVFDSSNVAAVSLLGDPSQAVRYSDCSHFKKAATLRQLISSGLGSSLQAFIISTGIEFQVHTLEHFKEARCVVSISPSLSTTAGIRPSFPDKCLLRNNRESEQYDDWYCSSLHGWMRRKKGKSASSKDSHFEDVVPLSGEYGSSHADLAMPAVAIQDAEGSKELSINKKLEGSLECRSPNIVGQLHAVEWGHDRPFVDELVRGGKPVVLRNTVVQTWRALQRWNMTYLLQNMGTDVLHSVKCTNNYLTFDADSRVPLKLNISLPYSVVNMSTADFYECVRSNKRCSDGFVGHYYFGEVPDGLKKDIQPDRLLYHTGKDIEAARQFLWISSPGMITHTHFDQDYNFFVQLVGEKRFTLWAAEQHELMYMYPRVHPLWHKSRVNIHEVDISKFPGFSRARAVQVKLGPGDMLYLPPYTWHYVETLSPSVSLSTWSHDHSLYDHMNSIYRHDHKFDLLQNKKGILKMIYV